MTNHNVHADHPTSVPPNCEMSPTWRRDPIDGRLLMPVLDELAARRGEAHVAAVIRRWLSRRGLLHLDDGPPLGPRGPPVLRLSPTSSGAQPCILPFSKSRTSWPWRTCAPYRRQARPIRARKRAQRLGFQPMREWMSGATRALVCVEPGGRPRAEGGPEMAAKKKTAKRKKSAGKKGRPTELAPGTVIEKTFKGTAHKVQVTADGYLYNRKSYKSLTAVALAITGYKAISGPRFFGTDGKGGAA